MIQVLFHYEAGPLLKGDVVKLAGDMMVHYCDQADEVGFRRMLPGTEAIWHVLKPISADHIAHTPTLKLIQKIGVGVNTIDLEAARAAGVAVCNMPGTNAQAVAEMTLLLMLSALRQAPQLDRLCRSGTWVPDETVRESLGEVAGRTVGLVGYGEIPARLAPMLEAVGATVVYTAQSDKPVRYQRLALEQLLRTADIVSLHIPLTTETEGLLGSDRLSLMKTGAILINTARGALVDEAALYQALLSGKIAAAGLDVFDPEPALPDNPLLALKQVVVSPHIAWLTRETFRRSLDIAIQNTRSIMTGAPLQHRIV